MQGSARRIVTGLIFFATTIIVAVLGYIWFGWSPLEAIYMVVITIFGVGYGEVKPLETPFQRVFTMFVILAGTTSAVYIVGGFIQMITEGEIHRALDTQRKQRTIANLCDHAIICGFDRMGQVLARQLDEAKYPFAIVDRHGDRVNRAESLGYLVRCGDPTDERLLEELGIYKAKVLATVLPEDADNVFITLTARELNPNLTILARGELPSTERKLRLAGADRTVLPLTISAVQMSKLIAQPTTIDFLNRPDERSYLNDLLANVDVKMDELSIPEESSAIGKTIMEIEVRGKGAFIVIALRRADGRLISHPHPSQVLVGGDALIVLGHCEEIPEFARQYDLKCQQLFYRRRYDRSG